MTALVTDNLPLVSGAPGGIAKLRELILDLAIRGKLVAHEPTDAPVNQLLAEIESARRLIARSKKASAVSDVAPPPFDIPRGWAWIRLGDLLSKIGAGSTPLGGKQAYVDAGVKFLRSQNVWNDGLRLDDVALISAETHARMSGTHVQPGDILFNITGASIGRCALVPDSFDTGNVSQHVTIIRPLIPETRRYLHTALMSKLVQDTVMDVQVGVSREGLSIGKLAQFYVPLPPLAEQHRIVAKVDELMALCDRLEAEQADAEAAHAKLVEALLASLTQARDAADFRTNWRQLAEHFHTLFTTEASVDALKQTVLQLAVTGRLLPLEPQFFDGRGENFGSIPLPRHWDVVPFDDLVDQNFPIAYGVLVPGPEDADGVPFVRIADLSLSAPPPLPEKTISREVDAKFRRTRLVGGEILMGVVGSIGKLGIAPPSWAGANIARAICRIVPAPTVSREFVLWLLQSDLMRNQFIGDTRTLAQPTLNVGLIRAARTPLPPLDEQRRIVAKVDELLGLCDQLKQRLEAALNKHEQVASALVEQAVA